MKKIFLIVLILITTKSYADVRDYENINYIEYDLYRNDKLIGYHKYDFIRKDDTLLIKSEVNFKITKLGVDLYKYFAASEEIYKNNKFFEGYV